MMSPERSLRGGTAPSGGTSAGRRSMSRHRMKSPRERTAPTRSVIASVGLSLLVTLVAACGGSSGSRPAGRPQGGTETPSRCRSGSGTTPGSTAPAGQGSGGVRGTNGGAGATPSSTTPPATSSGTSSDAMPPGTSATAGGSGGSGASSSNAQSPIGTPSSSSPTPSSGACSGSGYQTSNDGGTGSGGGRPRRDIEEKHDHLRAEPRGAPDRRRDRRVRRRARAGNG